MILAFGLYNIHSFSKVTEGGILGLELLFDHWFNISPAVSGLIMNAVCYAVGLALLGSDFIVYSLISGGAFSLSYAIFELFPPIFPGIGNYPLLAAVLGAVFVGVGVGISVRSGGAPGGDDALALSLSKISRLKIEWIYFIFDVTVLGLSLTYIPLKRILFSLLSVLISSKLVGVIQRLQLPKRKPKRNK
ncbi:MAG: YitT family protein [Ruminococcaceae bacterium]|nr:YitT family protein [Oscillospiraceae bacterium]